MFPSQQRNEDAGGKMQAVFQHNELLQSITEARERSFTLRPAIGNIGGTMECLAQFVLQGARQLKVDDVLERLLSEEELA